MEALTLAFMLATQAFNLTPGLLSAICYTESKHDIQAINHNDRGSPSFGVCQIKLATARGMGYRGPVSKLHHSAAINTFYAAKYLRHQLDRYHGDIPKAVAAYNAGTYRINEKGLIKNRLYVTRVFQVWAGAK